MCSKRPAECDRILLRRMREFVDEALDDEEIMRRPDAAPPRRHHARRLVAHIGDMMAGMS